MKSWQIRSIREVEPSINVYDLLQSSWAFAGGQDKRLIKDGLRDEANMEMRGFHPSSLLRILYIVRIFPCDKLADITGWKMLYLGRPLLRQSFMGFQRKWICEFGRFYKYQKTMGKRRSLNLRTKRCPLDLYYSTREITTFNWWKQGIRQYYNRKESSGILLLFWKRKKTDLWNERYKRCLPP